MFIMTAPLDTPQSSSTLEGNEIYHDEYVQLALFSLMKNLCADIDECQTSSTPSTPSTPVDVQDAFHYKLEQAADLVKTHLLYAVREEVDALRGKLSDLEIKISSLEKENTLLLREYVPPEILEGMGPDMADRFMKRRRSSACNPPNVQQLHMDHPSNTLSVPKLTDQPRLVNPVDKAPLLGSC